MLASVKKATMHASQAILAARSMLAAAHAAANNPADQEADNEWADTTDGFFPEEEINWADAMDEEGAAAAAAAAAAVEAAAGAHADAVAAAVPGDMWAWDDEVSCCHEGFLFAHVCLYCFETQCQVSRSSTTLRQHLYNKCVWKRHGNITDTAFESSLQDENQTLPQPNLAPPSFYLGYASSICMRRPWAIPLSCWSCGWSARWGQKSANPSSAHPRIRRR